MQARPIKLLSICYYCTHRLVRENSSQNVTICFTSRGESRRHTRESLFLHVGKPHATRGISPPLCKKLALRYAKKCAKSDGMGSFCYIEVTFWTLRIEDCILKIRRNHLYLNRFWNIADFSSFFRKICPNRRQTDFKRFSRGQSKRKCKHFVDFRDILQNRRWRFLASSLLLPPTFGNALLHNILLIFSFIRFLFSIICCTFAHETTHHSLWPH